MDMVADHLAQRPVEQVRAGVVLADALATFVADGEVGVLAELDRSRGHDAAVTVETRDGELGV